jgi:hypothetical protein
LKFPRRSKLCRKPHSVILNARTYLAFQAARDQFAGSRLPTETGRAVAVAWGSRRAVKTSRKAYSGTSDTRGALPIQSSHQSNGVK